MAQADSSGRRWRLAATVVGLAAIGALVWAGVEAQGRRQLAGQLDARYQQRFFDAVQEVETVEVLLSKVSAVSSRPMAARLFAELWQHAFAAQSHLSQLPLPQGRLMRTTAFLTQVGDYGFRLGLLAAGGRPPSDDQQQELERLASEAGVLAEELYRIHSAAADGAMPWAEVQEAGAERLGDAAGSTVGFRQIEEQMSEFPTLIYDGPFSDHVRQREPQGLDGPHIHEAEAERAALAFVGRDDLVARQVREVRSPAVIPSFGIELHTPDDPAPVFHADVSQQGGRVVWLMRSQSDTHSTDRQIGLEEAEQIGNRYLQERGFDSMVPVHAALVGDYAVIPYVPEQDGIVVYPDMVKLQIDLDDGEVVAFDARQYWQAHRERSFPDPELTGDAARGRVAASIDVTSVRLALIPREDLSEVLTYEVEGRTNGETFLIYINAQTGREERILQLVRTEEGTLTR